MSWVLLNQKRARMADARRPLLNTFSVALYQNDATATQFSTDSTFVIADFPGYANQPVTGFGTPGYLNSSNNGEVDCTPMTWTCSASGPGNNIFGVLLLDTDGHVVAAWRDPNAPIAINTFGQQYIVNLTWSVGNLC